MSASATAPLTIGFDGRYLQDKFHGVGRYAYGLLTGLCALPGSHRVVLFADPHLPNHRFDLAALTQSGKLTIEPIALPLYGVAELWGWPALLRRVPVDVFHSPFFWSPLLLPCPLVATFHDMIFDRYPQYVPGRRFLLPYKAMSRLVLRRARRIIAVSEATRQDMLHFARANPAKIVTILEGVERRFMQPIAAALQARVQARYDLPVPYVLALGARRPHKNIDRLVAAYSRIAATVPQALVLAGTIDPRFVDQASSTIAELQRAGRVREIAQVAEEDLPALYASADLFVQPSIIEGFGLPMLEAMACGCPVACSNTSSLPEVAGDAAISFDPWSEAAMAEALGLILTSPALRDDLRQRGRQRAEQLSWTAAAAQTLAVYQQAAGVSTSRSSARTEAPAT